jgi:acetyl-CoA C-acetyltransferase/acetyl-CoA acyltransferase
MAGRVAVVGAGQTRFWTSPYGIRKLFHEAVTEALDSVDNGLEASEVQEAWVGSLSFGGGQIGNLAPLMVDHAGLAHIPARRVENACASSGYAFRDAYMAVKSGAVDIALAGGVERMNDLPPERMRYWLGVSGDTEWERLAGLTFPGTYALMANRHMHEYGTTKEALAAVSVKAHRYGAMNPKAQFQKELTMEKVLGGRMVCDPFTLFDCCGTTDGASAAILVSEEKATELTDTPVWIRGSGAGTDYVAIHDRESLTRLDATIKAGRQAFAAAGLTPADVDLAEVHDCFTIAEILALEDLGFCKKGEGGRFTEEGQSDVGGAVAVNASGGLKSKGHPLGATGVGQVYELFRQLRGQADEGRQVEGAEIALAHNVGGSGASCAVHILST